tara:strand:- start:5695 stop:6330 length:636 start_codon:yes stop_codon:yes gene_type:complete
MGNFISRWANKNLLATQSPSAAQNKILSNPYLDKWNEQAEDYADFNSDYYKQGRSFFSDIYNRQAQDNLATSMNMNNRGIAQTGASQGIGFAQNEASRRRALDSAMGQTDKSLMDMWMQGQKLSMGAGDRAAGLYNQANEAYLNTKSQNDAARAQMNQSVLGLGANMLMPGLTGMLGFTGAKGFGEFTEDNPMGMWDAFKYGYRPQPKKGV